MPSWFPGAAFQKQAKVLRKIQEDFRHLPYNETIRNIVRLLCQNILRMRDLTGDRLLEMLIPRLWWTPSAISTRIEIWRIGKPSSRTPRPLSSSVGHLSSPPGSHLNPLCSCCRHNTVSCTYHVCRDALFLRGTVQGAGGA